MEKSLKGSGLSHLQFGVLKLISAGNSTIAELAKRMMLEPATLVPVIDILEKKKFLKRQHDLKDRRKNLLLITEYGKKNLLKIKTMPKNSAFGKILAKFGEEKSSQLLSLLQALAKLSRPDAKFVYEINQLMK